MIELKVEDMTCTHCVKAVTQALSEIPGVSSVHEVSLREGRGDC
jgi:copper chaperone CopZ